MKMKDLLKLLSPDRVGHKEKVREVCYVCMYV